MKGSTGGWRVVLGVSVAERRCSHHGDLRRDPEILMAEHECLELADGSKSQLVIV
ncbi:MAG: hypothetical protein ACNA7V_13650 [Bacteroidales bacterium]